MKFFLTTLILIAGVFFLAPVAQAAVLSKAPNNLGLVGYWPLNDSATNKAGDQSGQGNVGTLSNFALSGSSSNWVSGKHGGALSFDGSDDYVDFGNKTVFSPTTALTLSAWIKWDGIRYAPATTKDWSTIMAKGQFSSGEYVILFERNSQNTSNKINLYLNGTLTASWPNSGGTDTNWHLVTATYDQAQTQAKIYFDANLMATSTYSSLISSTSNTFRIGEQSVTSPYPFGGNLDDVRVYNRALTASDVSALYRSGQATAKIVSARGLVGQWTFDEGRGSQAGDSSQSRNTGTLSGSPPPSWVNGKRGKALSFDGSGNYVNVSSTSTLPTGQGARTVSAWVYQRSRTLETASGLVDLLNGGSGQSFTFALSRISATNCINAGASPNIFLFTDSVNSNNNICITGSQIPSLNAWHHIILTFDGGTAFTYYLDGVSSLSGNFGTTINTHTSGVNIGRRSSAVTGYTDAILDDVRIFNRALSASEAYALYKNGAVQAAVSQNSRLTNGLVGMWSFNGQDYNSASTTAEVLDRSGSNNNGDNIGAIRVGGKVGQGLSFDGSSTYVNAGNISSIGAGSDWTVAFWMKSTSVSNYRNPFDANFVASGNNAGPRFEQFADHTYTPNGNFGLVVGTGVGSYTIFDLNTNLNANTWYHVVAIRSGGNVLAYINGANQVNQVNALWPSGFSAVNIGRGYSTSAQRYFSGSLDEVRVYNRALSASEVYQLYNMGR